MSKICLVRHGETDWNKLGRLQGQTDIALNKAGKMQAKEVGEYLKQYNWRYAYSSPLKRVFETATIIAETIGISSINIDKSLIERNYGQAEGLISKERLAMFPDKNYPGQEDWYDLRDRSYNSILKYAVKHLTDDVIIVSHGAAINSILYTLSDGEFGSGITKLKNACMNMLEYDGKDLKVKFYNRSLV